MSNDCPKCNSQNRAGATFCDSCGASLKPAGGSGSSAAENTNGSQRKVNFGGLIIVVAVIAVVGWMLFGPSGNPSPGAPQVSGGSGQTENPHGGMDASAAGGGDDAAKMMEEIGVAKAKLDQDPLDTEALMSLYQTFGMIGRQEQIRPRLDAAVEALVAKVGDMEPAFLSATLSQLAYGALNGNDVEGAEHALSTVAAAAPDNLGIMVLRGDINFDIGRREESIAGYTAYLDAADPEAEGDSYWSARTDRATMYLELGDINEDLELTTKARDEYSAITKEQPNFFNAWFNLGLASKALDDTAAAEAAWEACVFLATNEREGYEVDKNLALLRGEDPPPVPASLQQQQQPPGGAGGGMANPHGGGMDMGGAAEGEMPNPHGGGDGGSAEPPAHSEDDH